MEMESGDTMDAYGRLQAYVFMDGKSVQGTLLREGYARLAYIMNKYLSQFKVDENVAKRNHLKIWCKNNYVGIMGL